MANKKNYRVYIALDLVTEDEGKSLAMVNIRRMSNEPCPMPVMTSFMQGMSKTCSQGNDYSAALFWQR